MKTITRLLTAALLTFALASCGSDTSDQAAVRFFNASANSNGFNIRINDTVEVSQLRFGEITPALGIDGGATRLRVETRTSAFPVLDVDRSFARQQDYTVIVGGPVGDLRATSILEEDIAPASGSGFVRFGHFAPSIEGIAVYITFPGQSIGSLDPAVNSLRPYNVADVIEISEGTYQMVVTDRRLPGEIYRSPSFTVIDGSTTTLILLDSVGGGRPLQTAKIVD